MPFKEIYAVSFAQGNLHPHVNPENWPDMQVYPPLPSPTSGGTTPEEEFQRIPDAGGIYFKLNRFTDTAVGRNSAIVIPPAGRLSIESRILLRATFDRPSATPHDPQINENWAVVLEVGDVDVATALVTCQFNPRRPPTGVRLNTPGSLEGPDGDYLLSPLNYDSYQEPNMAIEPPLFLLKHSFCGVGANDNNIRHTSGCGFLAINRPTYLNDHRVYSSNALIKPGSNKITSIDVLGVAVATPSFIGRISVRLRSFSVSINDPLP